MADEAFALSPINARASLPTDSDYDAICEAFMETSRGRWFLTEYTKRNRNTDTRMVLDAIERLEQNLSRQKQAQADAQAQLQAEAAPTIDLWPELAKSFTKTRIEIAQRLVHESNQQAFEAIRASVEAIKSVSWALRERGFDGRICDFLDLQVNAITDGYTGLLAESSVSGETEADVLAAFDALIAHVEALTKNGDAETEALDAVVDLVADAMNENDSGAIAPDDDTSAPIPADESEASIAAAQPIETAQGETVTTVDVIAAPDTDAAFRQIYGDDGDIEFVEVAAVDGPAPIPTEPEINRQRLYEAKIEPYRPPPATAPVQVQSAAVGEIEIVDLSSAESGQPTTTGPVARSEHGLTVTIPQAAPAGHASLGQALLASGMIPDPAGRSDPLAPFRRMSQAEKIAFFT